MLRLIKAVVKRIPFVGPFLRRKYEDRKRMAGAAVYIQWLARRIADRAGSYPAPRSNPPQFDVLTLTFDTPLPVLQKTAESLLSQDYPHWRWVIWDNCSSRPETLQYLDELSKNPQVVVHRGTENLGITQGHARALPQCDREYVVLLDHDDLLDPDALRIVAWHIDQHGRPGFLYTDEDKCDMAETRFGPSIKPGVSPALILDTAYTCHLSVIRRELLVRLGAFTDARVEGSQDWDMTMRLFESGCKIVHVPEVVYTWRGTPESAAIRGIAAKPYVINAQKNVVTLALQRRGVAHKFRVESNPLFRVPAGHWRAARIPEPTGPLIDIVVVADDSQGNWRRTAAGILQATDYPNFRLRILGALPCGAPSATLDELRQQFPAHVSLEPGVPGPLNMAGALNQALRQPPPGQAPAEFMAVVPIGARIISREWLWEALGCFELNPQAAAVVGRMFGPSHNVVGGPALFGLRGSVEVAYVNKERDHAGHFGVNFNHRNACAFLSAPWVAKRKDALQIGGFDPAFPIAYFEVDFAARCHKAGRHVVASPHIAAYGKRSTGWDDAAAQELATLFDKHVDLIRNDPFYSPYLSLDPLWPYSPASPEERAAFLNPRMQLYRVNIGEAERFCDAPLDHYEVLTSTKRAA